MEDTSSTSDTSSSSSDAGCPLSRKRESPYSPELIASTVEKTFLYFSCAWKNDANEYYIDSKRAECDIIDIPLREKSVEVMNDSTADELIMKRHKSLNDISDANEIQAEWSVSQLSLPEMDVSRREELQFDKELEENERLLDSIYGKLPAHGPWVYP